MITRNDIIKQFNMVKALSDKYDNLPLDETSEEKEDELLVQIEEATTKLIDMVYSFMGGKLDKQMIEKIIHLYPDRVYNILTR